MNGHWKYIIICLGVLFLFAGCSGEQTHNPASPALISNAEHKEGTSARVHEDTFGSDIESPQYPEGTIVIVAVGNSITYGIGTYNGGYPAIMQSMLQSAGYNAIVINEGIPGERSPETDERFLEVIAGADVVLIMIGTNDVVNPSACLDPYNCQTLAHIESLIDRALISKTIPIVSTIPPANPASDYSGFNPYIEGLNMDIIASASQKQVLLVDNYQAIMANGGSALYVDSLHFTQQGNQILANQWYEAIISIPGLK